MVTQKKRFAYCIPENADITKHIENTRAQLARKTLGHGSSRGGNGHNDVRPETIGRIVLFGALVLALGLGACKTVPELPDELVRQMRELEGVSLVLEDGDVPPPESPADPGAPVMVLRAAQDVVRSLLRTADRRSQQPLRSALQEVEQAWHVFSAGSPDLKHLGLTTDALHRAEVKLKVASRTSGPYERDRIAALQAELADVAKRMARTLLRRAEASGVRPPRLTAARRLVDSGELAAERSDYEIAVVHFGGTVKLAANTMGFDVALFEQNIIDALAGQTTGHAFSIAYQSQLYQSGESSGLARTAANPPSTAQSPGKEMHVASVSKTLTAILVLRLLEENGLTPEATVAPYLPSNWVLGAGVDTLTFRDFMTHRSGFADNGAGNSYQALRDAIAMDVGDTSGPLADVYNNGNFGLMRVLVAGLMGIDPVDYPEFASDVLTASAFLIYAKSVYSSIDVEVDCKPNDDTPTVLYNFPDDGSSPGFIEPNHQLTCGGYGWFISSNELAAVLTNLRNTENLLSAEARAMMQEESLGWDRTGGDFGVYYKKGGDWCLSGGELHACAAAFPIEVEAALVINSEHEDSECTNPTQWSLLRTAFDEAWVAN